MRWRPPDHQRRHQGRAEEILGEIQDGTFARERVAEDDNGRPHYTQWAEEGAHHPIEVVGATLRPMMAWIDKE